MKKLAILCFVLCFAAIVFSSVSVVCASATENVTVYFYNSKNWTSVNAHCYVLGGTDYTTWPGEKLDQASEVGDGWYKYVLPDDSDTPNLRIQFNDGTEDNATDVRLADDEHVYFNAYRRDGFVSAQEALANNSEQVIDSTGKTKVYFYNSKRWKTVYAYAYGTDASETEYTRKWPGNITSKDEERENWYYIEINQDCEQIPFKIIFNNQSSGGVNQSLDVLITDHKEVYLNFSGQKFDGYEKCEEVTPLEELVIEEVLDPNDFYLNFDKLDVTPNNVSVVNNPSIVAPVTVLCVAAAACIALGAVLIIRRIKKK